MTIPTGLVRRIDVLGRLVLPKEIRTRFNLGHKEAIEFFINDKQIILQKYTPCCIFTGTVEDLIEYNGIKVSRQVIKGLAKLV